MHQPHKKLTPKSRRLAQGLLAGLLFAALVVSFGVIYFDDHAWGTWGDDSAGYIYLAGRLLAGQPNVYFDPLAAAGQEFFGDERLARWLTPTHHQFINTHGVLASKYPVGISLLMVAAAKLAGTAEAFYFVTPLAAAVSIGLLYLLALQLLPSHPWRHLIGVTAGLGLGLSQLYYDYAIAQPMREIPSIALLLGSICLLVAAVKRLPTNRWLAWALLAGSALTFGMAFNVRETTLLALPGLLLFGLIRLWQPAAGVASNTRRVWSSIAVFSVALVVALIPTIQNSVAISKEKEVFKKRDTSEVVILSNIGHLQTVSLENAFNNEGKFRPGKGALPHYWQIMQNSSALPYFLALVALGLLLLWRRDRATATLLGLWIVGVLGIFSLWINPYSRYILPLFPPLMLLGAYGLVEFFRQVLPAVVPSRTVRAVALVSVTGALLLGYQPALADIRANLQTDIYRFKAISRTDLQTLVALGEELETTGDKPVLMFSGDWQYGTSETLEAHTGLKTIRFPLEQQKFLFDEAQVNAFFDRILADGYDLTVWADSTSSAAFYAWLEARPHELVQELNFSFQPQVRIYRLTTPTP